jgi:hypothetical protein
VQGAAAPITVWAAEPWALALFASERPLLFKLDDLRVAVDGDGDRRSTQATGTQPCVGFQQPVIGPFQLFACSERCDH